MRIYITDAAAVGANAKESLRRHFCVRHILNDWRIGTKIPDSSITFSEYTREEVANSLSGAPFKKVIYTAETAWHLYKQTSKAAK